MSKRCCLKWRCFCFLCPSINVASHHVFHYAHHHSLVINMIKCTCDGGYMLRKILHTFDTPARFPLMFTVCRKYPAWMKRKTNSLLTCALNIGKSVCSLTVWLNELLLSFYLVRHAWDSLREESNGPHARHTDTGLDFPLEGQITFIQYIYIYILYEKAIHNIK